jgi:CHAT domain-containing protein
VTDATELATTLLARPALAEWQALLRASDALHASNLAELLDLAEGWLSDDPGKARQLAEICGAVAGALEATDLVARATYLRAQTHYINAEFDLALNLIEQARERYLQANHPGGALRTDLGKMGVLIELGHYQDALLTGQAMVAQVHQSPDTAPEMRQIVATAQQNMGMAYELTGAFDAAMTAYADAETQFLGLGLPVRAADVGNNRGVALLSLGHANEALAAFKSASSIFAEQGLALRQAQTLINQGNAHLLLGQHTLGLTAFDEARTRLEPLEAQADKQVLLLDVADAHLALNLYPEALAAYREADAALSDLGMSHDHARALWGAGSALMAQGQWGEAEPVLAQAAAAFEAAHNTPMLCQAQLQQSALLLAMNEQRAALGLAQQVLGATSGKGWPMQQAQAHLRIAASLWPDAIRALPHVQAAAVLAESVGLPLLQQQVRQHLGHTHLLQNQWAEAEIHLLAAVDDIEQSRSTLAQERMRAAFLGDKLAAYEDLIHLYVQRREPDDLPRAFAMAERAKSRALADVLSGQIKPASLTNGATNAADDALHQRLRALQNELDATYTALLRGEDDGDRATSKALDLERELSRLQLQTSVLATGEAAPNPSQQDVAQDVLTQLPKDAIVISYVMCGNDIIAFVVIDQVLTDARVIAQRAQVQPALERLQAQWDRFREGTTFTQRHMPLLTQSAQRVLSELYDALLKPIAPCLGQARSHKPSNKLIIVPHGLLHHVPFHALFDGERYVLDDFEVSYIPSATLWALCQQRRAPGFGHAAVFGVADASIPAATREARVVAGQLPGASLRTNEQATLAEFGRCSPGCDWVHLACHGFFRADNPLFSSLKLHDGWLMAADVPNLNLEGALVTLSACESGRSQVLAGDELVGLSRAFLGAGAATLITSLWLVNDETTATMMQQFYAALAQGSSRAMALRQAQLDLKASHPHPYFWAPFVLVGQR